MIRVGKQEVEEQSWHPNFGDTSALPDIKVVRTGFFFSAIALTIAIVVSMYVGFREYRMISLEKNISLLEKEIEGYGSKHNEVINHNREFMDLRTKFEEAEAFIADQLIISDFLFAISKIITEEMTFKRVEYTGDTAEISGMIRPGKDDAAFIFDRFKSELQKANVSQSLFDNYEAKSLKRDEKMGTIEFSIELNKLEEDLPAPKKKND